MDLDEALEYIEDATPHEDLEAWIAQLAAAAVRHLRQVLIDQGICVHWTGEVDARVRVPDPSCPYCSLDGTP